MPKSGVDYLDESDGDIIKARKKAVAARNKSAIADLSDEEGVFKAFALRVIRKDAVKRIKRVNDIATGEVEEKDGKAISATRLLEELEEKYAGESRTLSDSSDYFERIGICQKKKTKDLKS